MKPQDIVFVVVLLVLLYRRDPKWAAGAGLIAIILAIPLFAKWIFFTAERLIWYAAAFLLLSVVLYLFRLRK